MEAGARKVLALTDQDIESLVRAYGPRAKAEQDELIRILKARREDIRRRFPNAAPKKAVAAAKDPDYVDGVSVTPEEAELITQSRSNGYSLRTDKDEIEDQDVLFWEERTQTGKTQTAALFKARNQGSKKLNSLTRSAQGATAKPTIPTHVKFETFDKSLHEAMGGLAQQSRQGEALRSKDIGRVDLALAQYEDAIAEIRQKIKSGDLPAAAVDTFKEHFEPWMVRIREAKQIGEGKVFKFAGDEGGTTLHNKMPKLQIKLIEKKVKVEVEKTPDLKWTKVNGRYAEKIAENGHLRVAGGRAWEGGYWLETEINGYKVKYWPDTEDIKYALRGRVEIVGPETGAKAVKDIQEVMERLGINAARATVAEQEELYLTQLFYLRNKPSEFATIMSEAKQIASQSQRIEFLKRKYNTAVGRNVTDGPDYRPHGTRQAFGQGRTFHERPDLNGPEWDTFERDYRVIHQNTVGDYEDAIDRILNSGGMMAPTTDKLRRGITVRGMSPDSDLGTGGASYFFTRIYSKQRIRRGGDYFVFKTKILKRTDAISYPWDKYGACKPSDISGFRKSSIPEWTSIAGHSSNETIFKHGLSLFDALEYLVIRNGTSRSRIIAIIKRHLKSDYWPDGRRIEEVVVASLP
jgi:hypothetical protein